MYSPDQQMMLQQFFRDPQTGQAMMMPHGGQGPGAGGPGRFGVAPSFEMDPTAMTGVEPPPQGGAQPLPPYAGGGGAEPFPMPPPTFGPGGGAMPLGGGAQPLQPSPMMRGQAQPIPTQGGGSAQRLPIDVAPGVGAAQRRGIDQANPRDAMMDRLVEAIMRARMGYGG